MGGAAAGADAAAVATGDAILATFFLRTETPQEGSVGETEFVFELSQGPYTKSVSYPVQAGSRGRRSRSAFRRSAPTARARRR